MAAMNALARIPPTPLKVWADGTIRVQSSQVLLDVVVRLYKQGASAEQILHNYPSLAFRDVSDAIIYYLEHIEEIVRLRAASLSWAEIGSSLGLRPETCRRALWAVKKSLSTVQKSAGGAGTDGSTG